MIVIEKIGVTFMAYGGDVDDIQDISIKRFIEKLTSEPELETAYRLGEFDFRRLEPEVRENIENLLASAFIKANYLDGDDEKELTFSDLSQEPDFTSGNAYRGY